MSDDRVSKEHQFEGNHYAEQRYVLNIGLRKAELLVFDFITDYDGLVAHKATADDDHKKDPYKNFEKNNVQALDFIVPRIGFKVMAKFRGCLLYTSPSPRDRTRSRMPSSA